MELIDQLLSIRGVFAAGNFDAEGHLNDFKTNPGFDLDAAVAANIAKQCAVAHRAMNGLGAGLSEASGLPWEPGIGWVYSGGEYSVAVSNGFGVFVQTMHCDFNDLFNAMVGAR